MKNKKGLFKKILVVLKLTPYIKGSFKKCTRPGLNKVSNFRKLGGHNLNTTLDILKLMMKSNKKRSQGSFMINLIGGGHCIFLISSKWAL